MKLIPDQYKPAIDVALKELREIEARGELTVDVLARWTRKHGSKATYRWLAHGLAEADTKEGNQP